MSHSNISIFVPHKGCPNDCSFCNQRTISGQTVPATPEDVAKAVNTAIEYNVDPKNTEIAFFGGSFTAIEREYMCSLLTQKYPNGIFINLSFGYILSQRYIFLGRVKN